MEKTINLEVSRLMASCLSRMLVTEIVNQKAWMKEDAEEFGITDDSVLMRQEVIDECEKFIAQLVEKGFQRYIR